MLETDAQLRRCNRLDRPSQLLRLSGHFRYLAIAAYLSMKLARISATMTEDEKENIQRRLMQDGYYPENIPPVFQISSLHSFYLSSNIGNDYISERGQPTRHTKYNSSKRGMQRRIFSMPNPVFIFDSSVYFINHFDDIMTHLDKSPFSLSIPRFSNDGDRALTITSPNELAKEKRQRLATSRYIVRTDIARFFPTIYTHSIPWALNGKSSAKRDRKPGSKSVFGNRLDHIVRSSQDGQTNGIPIGPDISRVISEIVASAIDQKFYLDVPSCSQLVRHVDDVWIGAQDSTEASNLFSHYRESIRAYELDINESKTSIIQSKHDLEPYWPVEIWREINSYTPEEFTRYEGRHAESDLVLFLDKVLEMANNNQDDGIIKYCIRSCDQAHIWEKHWSILEPFLARCAVNYSHCLDYVSRVIAWRSRKFGLKKEIWSSVSLETIESNARAGNDAEVSWMLWLMKELELELDSSLCELIIRRCGAFPALIILDMQDNGIIKGRIEDDIFIDKIGPSPMLGDFWLLAYEAYKKYGIGLKSSLKNGHDIFEALIESEVSFYNTEALPKVFSTAEQPEDVDHALERRIGLYEDTDESDEYEEFF